MIKFSRTCRRTLGLMVLTCVGAAPVCSATKSTRNLNPYHEQQLESQIRKCASGVLACTDAEQRSVKQQELCQLLIRAERYDEALQVSYNIYKSEERATERRAAYHFMVAEIHNRKMKAARTTQEMDASRQDAIAAAQDVLNQKYPSNWHVSDYARELVRELSDSTAMAKVRQRVASRQGTGDITKEAIADAQRKYLDATQGNGPATHQNQPRFVRSQPQERNDLAVSAVNQSPQPATMAVSSNPGSAIVETQQVASQPIAADHRHASRQSLPDQPQVSRVVSPLQRLSPGESQAMNRLGSAGLLTSQPGVSPGQTTVETQRQPILVNGQPAQSNQAQVESIVQNNLATLLESARKRKAEERKNSPYATGQLPETSVR